MSWELDVDDLDGALITRGKDRFHYERAGLTLNSVLFHLAPERHGADPQRFSHAASMTVVTAEGVFDKPGFLGLEIVSRLRGARHVPNFWRQLANGHH